MLKKLLLSFCCLFMFSSPLMATENPHVLISTNVGDIVLELNQDKAPITVKNFLDYVDSGFYNDTIFHRVISGFMIQGGGFSEDMTQKSTLAPIKNEANNGLSNVRGSIAMARTGIIDSATSQFFINVVDNDSLNHSNNRDFGYAVFGKVVKGMDVVDKIAKSRTTQKKGYSDVPAKPITIISAKRL